ncbi:hypothetical protein SEVIR_1G188650v4 [Setaria viridis]
MLCGPHGQDRSDRKEKRPRGKESGTMESIAMESGAICKFGMESVVMNSASTASATVAMEFSVVQSGAICNSGVMESGITSICESGTTSISKSSVTTSSGSCDFGGMTSSDSDVMTSVATPARSPATPPHPRRQTPRRAPPAPLNSMANSKH